LYFKYDIISQSFSCMFVLSLACEAFATLIGMSASS